MSAWNCMSAAFATMPPSTRSSSSGSPASAFTASSTSGSGTPSPQGRTGDVALVREPGKPDDDAAGVRAPVRCEEAGERRHEVHAAVVFHREGELLDVGRLLVIPRLSRSHWMSEPVTAIEPSSAYTGSASPRRYATVVIRPFSRMGDLRAGVEDEEVARAVGVLRLAGAERGLAEGRRLLVAEDARDRDARAGKWWRRLRRRPRTNCGSRGAARAGYRTRRGARRPTPGCAGPSAACGWRS